MTTYNKFLFVFNEILQKFNEFTFICNLKRSNNFLIKKLFNIYSNVKKNPNFIFLNYYDLNNKQLNYLKKMNIRREKSIYTIKYEFKDSDKKVILLKLNEKDLYKINYILENDIIKGDRLFNWSLILRDILKAIDNDISIWDKYRLSYMNRYLKYTLINERIDDKYIGDFLKIYRYTNKQIIGESVIDIGSCDCYFPIIVKVMNPKLDVTASDKTMDGLLFLKKICNNKKIKVNILKLDILKNINAKLRFDTVVNIHVLEHIPASLNFEFINNCLKLADKRVITVVPIEKKIQILEHKQVFNENKLIYIANKTKLPYLIKKINNKNLALIIDKQ